MPQNSKLLKSRDSWKDKARMRADMLREARKTQKRHKQKIAELKSLNKELQSRLAEKKNRSG